MNALTTNQMKKLQSMVSFDNTESVRALAFIAFMIITKQSLKSIKVNAKSSGLKNIALVGSFKELHHAIHAEANKMGVL